MSDPTGVFVYRAYRIGDPDRARVLMPVRLTATQAIVLETVTENGVRLMKGQRFYRPDVDTPAPGLVVGARTLSRSRWRLETVLSSPIEAKAYRRGVMDFWLYLSDLASKKDVAVNGPNPPDTLRDLSGVTLTMNEILLARHLFVKEPWNDED